MTLFPETIILNVMHESKNQFKNATNSYNNASQIVLNHNNVTAEQYWFYSNSLVTGIVHNLLKCTNSWPLSGNFCLLLDEL